jgi:hypothetical protein
MPHLDFDLALDAAVVRARMIHGLGPCDPAKLCRSGDLWVARDLVVTGEESSMSGSESGMQSVSGVRSNDWPTGLGIEVNSWSKAMLIPTPS